MKELEAKLYGKVQGVGLRQLIKREAQARELVGYVQNIESGPVELLVQGDQEILEEFLEEIRKGTIYSEISEVKVIWHNQPQDSFTDFEIW